MYDMYTEQKAKEIGGAAFAVCRCSDKRCPSGGNLIVIYQGGIEECIYPAPKGPFWGDWMDCRYW